LRDLPGAVTGVVAVLRESLIAPQRAGDTMPNFDATVSRPPLVLLVDPILASRHSMWRVLSRGFGVIEAGNATAARAWMTRRPDIDALVVEDDLPDERGLEFVRGLAKAKHPIVSRAIVLSRRSATPASSAPHGATLIERGDLREVLSKLATWILTRDAMLGRALLREAERFQA
jgi:hypothetical protein